MHRYIEFSSERCVFKPIGNSVTKGSFADLYPELCRFIAQTSVDDLLHPECPYFHELDSIIRDLVEFEAYKNTTQKDDFFFAAFTQTGIRQDVQGQDIYFTTDDDVKLFTLERIKNWHDTQSHDYEFAVVVNDEVVGYAELFDRKIVDGKLQYERGVFIDPTHQKYGYGKEAMVAMTRFAFEYLHVDQIFTMTDPNNIKSRNNIEKNFGATFIGEEPSKYAHLSGGGTNRRRYLIFPDNFYAVIGLERPTPVANDRAFKRDLRIA